MAKYLLERFNGGSYYIPFDSIQEVDNYRKLHPKANGELWTQGGYLVNEKTAKEEEK